MMKNYFGYPLLLLTMATLLFTGCKNCCDSHCKDTDNTSTFDAAKGVFEVSPNLYKILSDTLNIRMLEGTYAPGDSSLMHAHPDFALYVLEGGTVELTSESGEKQTMEFAKDMAVVLPADNHSAKNIGESTLKLIVVEVDRPRK
jgi:quercetin dioxygenase-like cupin family protein